MCDMNTGSGSERHPGDPGEFGAGEKEDRTPKRGLRFANGVAGKRLDQNLKRVEGFQEDPADQRRQTEKTARRN